MTPENLDLIGGWVSLVLTLLVFSYLLGDNFLYRIAVHVLVGVAAGYTVIVALESVIVPWLNETLLAETEGRSTATMSAVRMVGVIPFLIGALLLFKLSPAAGPGRRPGAGVRDRRRRGGGDGRRGRGDGGPAGARSRSSASAMIPLTAW